ncbi:uncharacterized protein MYCFIDRAFT_199454 [Pseudocercospora fijiensis CIRAD86]|uniref:Uncharacterized protein n=1 Tax=Pseudocercospora fijiensis (strain CIRAD86) TaxID=383855 RepID=M3AQW1_PSEFD|nr:uncharacterized protein MYCFIDRAFT_199454 [Pseudocercospora fijiensis CIRAD86]EME79797.1 hypothetical protein MYCFIDRAFT_199454 [Pseudocercospora fijiensis CIRAD86]
MAISLEGIGETDLKRFASCWLNSSMQCNWDGAAATFDPEGKSKLASFKTVTSKAGKKYGGGGGDGGNGDGTPKKAAGGKRKKAAGEDGEGTTKKKIKGAGKSKKSEETVNEEDDGLTVKSEASAGEED